MRLSIAGEILEAGVGEGFCCTAPSATVAEAGGAVTAVSEAATAVTAVSEAAKVLAPHKQRNTRTSVVRLVAVLSRDRWTIVPSLREFKTSIATRYALPG